MRTISLIILISFFCSCNRKDADTSYIIDLVSAPESEITNLSDIASDVEYVPLQTSENSLIRFIYDIKISADKIYISPRDQILCFDKTCNLFEEVFRRE